MNILRQIVHYFTVYKKYLGRRLYLVFVLSALAAAVEGLGIAMLLPLLLVVDSGLSQETVGDSRVAAGLQRVLEFLRLDSSLLGILFLIAAIFFLKGFLVLITKAYQSSLQAQLMYEIKSGMFDRYSRMNYHYYCRHNTGHFVNIINAQVSGLIASFSSYKKFLAVCITSAVYVAGAFLLAWQFALMALCAGGLLLLMFRGLNARVHELSRKAAHEKSTLNKFLVQTVQSFKYLSATAEMGHLRKGVLKSIKKLARYVRKLGFATAVTESISEPIAISLVLVIIAVQVKFMQAPLAPIFVALIMFNRAMGNIMSIQTAWQSVLAKAGSLELVESESVLLERNKEISGAVSLGTFSESIRLENVCFAYEGSPEPVLRNLSLEIPANQTIAFVGESGAGKSTLMDVLTLMLRPVEGVIRVDGIPGDEIDLYSWRRQIGYVSQETVVFDDTIANNITLWKDDSNEGGEVRQSIRDAARQAFADHFIRELPEGYDTVVGDRGIRLSGGQRQRLFLARELYKNPRLLILDEATSALDSESEQFIKESIDALKGRLTVVVIAHRLSTIRNADYVYVMDKGGIAESGTYEELQMKPAGRLSRMIELQSLS